MSENGSNGLNELDRCKTCHHTRLWHDNNRPVHPFNNGDTGATAFLGKKGERAPARVMETPQDGSGGGPQVVWPTDPVLRVALIQAGVITADQLREAEEFLRASMGLEGNNGKSPEGTRGREV